MSQLRVKAKNFSSYSNLEFDFEKQGVVLIQGSNGSGKSTLCDVVPWTLFGKTAKNGRVDEVVNWTANNKVESTVTVETKPGVIYNITRIRENGSGDLYLEDAFVYTVSPMRGKDINDTQKAITTMLGFNLELYLSAAYYHEFSQTAQFFTASAKNRRELCEQLIDLSLPTRLQESISIKVKEIKKSLQNVTSTLERGEDTYNYMLQNLADYITKSSNWNTEYDNKVKDLQSKSVVWGSGSAALRMKLFAEVDKLKKKIRPADDFKTALSQLKGQRCKDCGSEINSELIAQVTMQMQENNLMLFKLEGFQEDIIKEADTQNPWILQLENLEKNNIYEDQIKELEPKIVDLKSKIEILTFSRYKYLEQVGDLEILSSVISDLRARLVKTAIVGLQDRTNNLLTKIFDSEFRVEFNVEEADKLEVTITKDGNECSYTQLSKGQRCMLKLCFGVSVMRAVAQHHAFKPEQIFFDESLDGLSDENKIKAYRLFEELSLEYDSVFVVDHSEALKSLFPNRYTVTLINGSSVIEKT